MAVATEGRAPVSAGAGSAELAVMRQAAARVGAQAGGAGELAGDDLFGALSGPFLPLPPDERAGYQRTGGHHWCTNGVLRAS
jgi:hypothetical protein